MCITLEDGKKIAMPRYFKDKIYDHDERSQIAGFQKGEIERRTVDEIELWYKKGDKYVKEMLHTKREAALQSIESLRHKTKFSNSKI